MFLRRKGLFTGLILSISFIVAQAQTLYWVGGSGNFNDPQHWSLSSGGVSASLTPGTGTDIIFDDYFDGSSVNVTVNGAREVRSLKIVTYKNINFLKTSSASKIKINQRFEDILDNTSFNSTVNFEFSKTDASEGYISTGTGPLSCDFIVNSGSWKINKITLNYLQNLTFTYCRPNFEYAYIQAGSLNISNCSTLRIYRSLFKISGVVVLERNTNYNAERSFLNKQLLPLTSPNINTSLNPGRYNSAQINLPCATFTVTKPTCAPGCDGKISITLPSFTCYGLPISGYSVSISGACTSGSSFTTAAAGTFTFSGLCSCVSDYFILVEDDLGNTLEFFNQPVTQPNISAFASLASTSTLACNGVCTGSINLTFFGGTAPYNFTITPPTGPTIFSTSAGSASQSTLCAGTLSVFTRDQANCTATFTRVFTQPPAYSSNSVVTNVICNSACDGAFTISPTGGTPNYTINFSTGPTFTAIPSQVVTQTGLCPGPITATLTDRNGCKIISTANITEPSTIIIVPTQTNISCGGVCSGVGQVSVTGGGGSYTYTWNPAVGSNSINSILCAGINTVTITDIPHGCVKTQTIDITQIAPIVITPTITHVVCFGNSTGSASISITGGTPTFQVTWVRASDNATVSLTPTLSGQPAGSYSIFVQDAVPCNTVNVITITQPASSLSISSLIQNATCPGVANGSATITTGGGNGAPFSFTWTPAAAGNTNIATGLSGGSVYVVSASDASACLTPTISVSISQPPLFVPNITHTNVSCNSASTGILNSSPAGGSAPYTFTLTSSAATITNATGLFSGLPASSPAGVGVYTLFVGDNTFPATCAQAFTRTITQPAASLTTAMSTVAPSCFGVCNGTLTINSGTSGTSPFTYTLTGPLTNINISATATPVTFTGRCAGVYTVRTVDANACVFTSTTQITQPSQLTVTVNSPTLSCFSSTNGVLTATASGGSGGFTFLWQPGAVPGNPRINVGVGVYSVTATDLAGCTGSITSTVTVPSSITVTQGTTQATCFGSSNGSATITVPGGGTPPYTYSLAGAPTPTNLTGIFSGLAAGTYTGRVTDFNGCISNSLNIVISSPLAITATPITTSVSCNGACTGVITVTPSGGIGPFTYTLTGPASTNIVTSGAAASATFAGRCAGNYTLRVLDASVPATCSQTFAVNIAQPTASLATAISTIAPTCFGVCNGTLSINSGTSGTSPFTYTLTGPLTNINISATATPVTFTGRCAGVYTVRTVDANSCVSTGTTQITQPTQLTVTVNSPTLSCFSSTNGVVTATATGGAGGFTFLWQPGAVAGNPLSNVGAGVYSVTATDLAGCASTVVTSTVTVPSSITVTQGTTQASCFGSSNGSATVTVTGGGTPPFTYSLAGAPTATNLTGIFSGLAASTYTGRVTDFNGCISSSLNIVISSPLVVSATLNTTSVSCNGACTGVITVTPSGGISPFTYTLTGPASTNIATSGAATSATFAGRCAGNYTIRVLDASLPATCSQTFAANIAQPTASLATAISTIAPTCFGVCNGTLSINSGTSGTSPFTYTLTGPLTNINISATATPVTLNGRCAGVYTVRTEDANSCVVTGTTQITQPTQLTVTVNSPTLSCFSSTNGILTATAAGGAGGFTFLWQPGAVAGNPLSNVGAGIYSVTATDLAGCASTVVTSTVTVPSSITVTQGTTETNCSGSSDGSATITVLSGGTPPFTYSLAGAPTPTNLTGIFTGLSAGSFTGRVTDFNGCTSSSLGITISSPLLLTAAITGTQNSCASCSGAATVTPGGGTIAYSFVWTSSVGVIPAATNATVNNLCPGPYTVTVTDSRSCTAVANVTISPIVIVVAASGQSVSCFSFTDGASSTPTIVGGNPAYSFSWTPSAQTTSIATNLSAGNYTLQVTDSSSPVNCVGTSTLTIVEPSSITIQGTVTNVTCPGLTNGAITTSVNGGPTATYSYSWSPSGQTVASPSGLTFGVHTVTVTSTNTSACTSIRSFTVGSPDPPITGTFTTFNPNNCAAPNNGSISIANGGGNSLYTYTWSATPSVTNFVTGLVAGPYQVTVTSNACFTVFTTTLTPPVSPGFSLATSQSVTCFGLNTGAATFTSAGAAPYSFTWSPATTSAVSGNSTSASNMPTGTYTVNVSDANNCAGTATVFIDTAPDFSVASTTTNVTCNNGNDGGISVITSGGTPGTPAYSYTWSTAATGNGTTHAISSLTASTNYSVLIRDGQNCTATRSFTITEPPLFSFTSSSVNPTCFGVCDGSIVITPTGNVGPVSYTWAAVPSATFAGSTNSFVTGLCAGIYTVAVTDGPCAAVGTTTIQITEPVVLSSTILVNHNATCFGDCNGTATYTLGGGTLPYTYTWTSSSSTAAIAPSLCAGPYTVSSTDANGCAVSDSFTITGPAAAFDATLTAISPLCTGLSNGSIATGVSGNQGSVSYSWSPTGTGQNPTGLGTGTNTTAGSSLIYTLVASDDSLCVITRTASMIQPQPLTANLTFTNPTCFGDCNGAAVATPSNAVGTTTVTWLPSSTISHSITGLCSDPFNGNPNIYTVNVVDGNACSDTFTFGLTTPTQLDITYTVGPALCGVANGSIGVTGIGGTGAYTFSWSPPISSSNTLITSLNPGLYTVSLTDINNCNTTSVIPISASNGPTANTASTNILCNGFCNGTASLSAITPTNATLQWLAPLPGTLTAATISSLCAGNYTVEITNPSNNCKAYYGFAITEPPPMVVTNTITTPTCFGICDGSVAITPSGGVPSYTFMWSGPSFFTTTAQDLNGICGGDFTLNIIDGNSCTTTTTYSVPVLNNIVIQQPVAVVNNSCFNDCIGSASINVVSTTTSVVTATLSWSTGQFGPIVNNLCSGIHTVIVTDTRGCSNSFSVPITAPPAIVLTNTIVQPDCNQCNGTAVVDASGGNGPSYSYSWTTGDTSPSIANLCAGLYQVVVSDANNCTQVNNVIINSISGFTGDTIVLQHEICATPCSGAATITPFGGAAPIAYTWINPALTATGSAASNLCAGSYFVQMTDANNCVRTSPFTINAANILTVSAFISPPTCGAGPPDGSVQILVTGSTGAPTYSWFPGGATTATLNNLGVGTYTVFVTDPLSGCSSSKVVDISNFTGPAFAYVQKNLSCNIAAGSITVTSTGTLNVSYLWSTGATSSVVSNLQTGPVTVTVTDVNGCRSIKSFTISADPQVEVNSNIQGIRCNNGCDGVITLLPLGGTLPYTFSLSPGTFSTLQTPSLCAGSYTIIVMDAAGCRDTANVNMVNPVAISPTVNATNSSCSTIADGQASVTASGGLAPYSYSWTGPHSYTAAGSGITGILAGNYSVNVVDSLGCISQSFTLTVAPTVTIEANAGDDVIVCPGTEVVLSGSNSIGAIAYYWLNAAGNATVTSGVSFSLTANELETGTYQLLTLSPLANCVDHDTVDVNVYQVPFLDAGTPSFTIPASTSTVIGGHPTTLAGANTHTWAPAQYLNDAFAQNPVTSNTIDITFTVSIIYGDNCLHSDTVQVKMLPEIIISSGFSPNGDGKNDTWIIDYIREFPDNSVEIYNRWGDRLFISKGYFEPFDGKYKGNDLPVGTYYYVIKLNNTIYNKPYTGPLTIFR